jgi:hypothetical protein
VEPNGIPSSTPSLEPSTLPSAIPSVVPTAILSSLPTSYPSPEPSHVPSLISTSSAILVPSPIPTILIEDGKLSCVLCIGGCLQSPNELFPTIGDDISVTCGVVENFVKVSGVTSEYCELLKTYAFLGACGGCGPTNCDV